jgi:hypothetical protein
MVEFLTPLGWLVACAALVPIAAALLRGRRDDRVRRLLRLPVPGVGARAGAAVAAAVAICLMAAATARPAIRTSSTGRVRTDAQVFFVIDVSRSMLARAESGPTRLARAVSATAQIHSALADVPAGIASLTDRPLPVLFPTANRTVFSSVLHESIGIERPPPEVGTHMHGVATTFDVLSQLATAGYFARDARHRLAILLTDGESSLYDPAAVATQLALGHVGLLVVRFWHAGERVYTNGKAERYRPDPRSLPPLRRLTARSLGIFAESALSAAERRARRWLGTGPPTPTGRPHRVELAPYAALAAIVPLAFLLWRRDP